MIIEQIKGNIRDLDLKGRSHEEILLDHEDMRKPHQKLRTEAGEVFAISLDEGHRLEAGAVIYEDEKRVVTVNLQPEKCLVVRPEGNIQWARAAFNIGNMHQAAYVKEDCILVAYDSIMENVIQKLNVPYTVEEQQLDGIRANVSQTDGHHHHHGHDHEHHHDHDHKHE